MNTKHWKKTLLDVNSNIEDAIKSLNNSGLQIVLVVSNNKTLVATITDGNIRKGLLAGLSIKDSINTIFTKDPQVVSIDMQKEEIIKLMKSRGVNSIPLIDERMNVLGLYSISEFITSAKKSNLMLIMAGGRGRRLLPYTQNCPKPLLKINGTPMLESIINKAKSNGFFRFVISVYYLGHMIEDYFGDGSKWDVEITYLRETSPLGTAGCLSLLESQPELPIIVSNGDIISDINYSNFLDFHSKHSNTVASMAVSKHEWRHPYGVVYTKGVDITGFEEKPITKTNINAGVYVISPSALDFLKPNEFCDMPSLFNRLNENKLRTIIYPIHESWMDVGREKDFNEINRLKG